ncbi:hypothetical protein C8R47DRAFT_1222016 [Mycena vitilis]|nr:hypothetical protein C8R47DRAFT_1222016 [Mycena vitilis]
MPLLEFCRMVAVDLPPEVEELVIDHLYNEIETLGSCGLVCESWLSTSRYHLFGAISLHTGNWREFLQLINSPLATFVPYIYTLTVSGSSRDKTPYLTEMLPELPVFPALKSLQFYLIAWTHVSKPTVDCLAQLVLNVTDLSLRRVSFRSPLDLVELLSRFPRLRRLSVEFRFWNHGGSLDPVDTQSLGTAHTLECVRLGDVQRDPAGHVLTWLNPAVGAAPIRVLQLGSLRRRSIAPLGKLLSSVGPELCELNLDFWHDVTADDIKTHIDLARNTSLRHLTVHPSKREGDNAPWALLAALHCTITALTLELSMTSVDVLDEFEWRDLNTTLKAHFSALRYLRILVKDGRVLTEGESPLRAALADIELELRNNPRGKAVQYMITRD